MPDLSQPMVAQPWSIRSVAVRTRDGPERLFQAYRRLLSPGTGMLDRPGPEPPATDPTGRS